MSLPKDQSFTMNLALQHICTWLLFLFLFLFTVPYLPVNSLPPVLFALLCLADWARVREMFLAYRREACLISAALLVGLAFSHLPSKSIKGIYDFLRGAIVFFPVMYLVQHHAARLVSALPWATFVAAFYLLGSVFIAAQGSPFDWSLTASSLLGNRNTWGSAAAVVCIAALVGLLHLRGRRRHGLLLAVAAIAGFLLTIYSGSRGSFLALAVVIFLLLLFVVFPRYPWRTATA